MLASIVDIVKHATTISVCTTVNPVSRDTVDVYMYILLDMYVSVPAFACVSKFANVPEIV